jgi:hypothetical protein
MRLYLNKFVLESEGFHNSMKRLRDDAFEDILALVLDDLDSVSSGN